MFEKNKLLRALLAAGLTTGLVACGGVLLEAEKPLPVIQLHPLTSLLVSLLIAL